MWRKRPRSMTTDRPPRTWMKALAGNWEIWALNLELSLYEYRNPGVRERSADQRRKNRATVASFMEHYSAAQGFTFKYPVETITAILLNASDGFVQAARIDTDVEALFATFLDLLIPAVMEPAVMEPAVMEEAQTRGTAGTVDEPRR